MSKLSESLLGEDAGGDAVRTSPEQQACSALLALLPVCDEYDNGESWTRGMVLSDAISFKNTWFWRNGDPWLGGIAELINDLAIPSEWVEWRGDNVALIRIGNVVAALTYVQDSRYECFALAWPNASAELPTEHVSK